MKTIQIQIDCDGDYCGQCFMKNKPEFGECLKFGYLEIEKIPVKIGLHEGILHETVRCQQCLEAEVNEQD